MTLGSRLKVVQVVTRRQYRGAEVFASLLSEQLARRGHQVLLLGLYPPAEHHPQPAGVEFLDLGNPRRGINPFLVLRLARELARLRPSVVQANGSDTLKYCSLARLISRRRWPLIYRNIGLASTWATSWWKRWLGRLMLRRVDRVVSVGRAAGADFALTYGYPPARVSVIRRGFAIDDSGLSWAQACALLPGLKSVPEQAPRLVHVGSFTPEKNQRWLLGAFRGVRARVPDCHLLLFGEGPLRSACEELCRERGLQDCVHFLGLVPEARRFMAVCDLLVLPSLTEGVPGVVVEAGLQGVPAVASDVGGVREVIRHGETGTVVEPGAEAAFVDAVAGLLQDPEARRRMGERARAELAGEFREDAVASRFEELYRSLV
ncbi:MAG: glycosyltransferase [Armatimonadetes bacterium]|nr:glycosyltransferase [Armatimonadota bacterium]